MNACLCIEIKSKTDILEMNDSNRFHISHHLHSLRITTFSKNMNSSGINPGIKNRKKVWVPKPLYGNGLKKKNKNKHEKASSNKRSNQFPRKKKKRC